MENKTADTSNHLASIVADNSEQLNLSIIQSIGDCVQVLDADGRLLYMNEVGQGLLSIDDIEPFLGTPYVNFCKGRDTDEARQALAEAQQGRKGRFVGFAATADGTPKWWDVVITPIFKDSDVVDRLLVISRDITEQKQAGEALAEREHLLRQAQSYAHIGNWSLDADGVTATWSEEIYRVLGLDATNDEAGPVTLAKVVHPDDMAEVKASLNASLEKGIEHKKEYRVIRPDGEIRWITCKGAPVFDDEGTVIRLLGIFQDITERKLIEEQAKASLKEKEMLLREIHHRVKNNLQVVSSLLSLQAMQTQNTEASDALTESCRRIQVMADIHNRLYGSGDIAQIEFDTFIQTLGKDIVSSYAPDSLRIEIEEDLTPIRLSIDAAIPCSLIISELLSNSIKHAFSDLSEGTIHIALKQHGESLNLKIKDSGTGMPVGKSPREYSSLGLKLVHALVEQLEGEIVFSRETGTCVSITFNAMR